jgi:dolichol-phosphate mannosyltransferase
MQEILIIVPTFNEVENIGSLLRRIFAINMPLAVLVVDDQSPDETAQLVKAMMPEFDGRLFIEERTQKQGLGKAYIHGFLWARRRHFKYIFEMDADFSHDPDMLPTLFKILSDGADVVIGSRYCDGINVVNWPLSRIFLSYFASLYVRILTGMPVKDPTAGYVGYRASVLDQIGLEKIRFVGYAFQIEMKYKAWKKGAKLVEHPIIFKNREKGVSKMNGSIIWEALFGVLFLRLQFLFKTKS